MYFLQDDDNIIWLHCIDRLITRIKYDHVESKLPNGISYCYNLGSKRTSRLKSNFLNGRSQSKNYFYEDQFAHLGDLSEDK